MSDRADLFVEHARRYAELGWSLVRLEGKVPQGKGWQQQQPDPDPEHLAGLWRTWGERWGMGIVLGPSKVAVNEYDTAEAGQKLLELLGGKPPLTPTVKTGSGRLHFYFEPPEGFEKAARDGIELRLGAHQCVLPPSEHPDTGVPYVWIRGREPWTIPLAGVPAGVLDFFAEARQNGTAAPLPEIIPIGEIDTTLTSLAGSMRRRNASEEAIYAALIETLKRCEPGHTHTADDCRRIASSVARYSTVESSRPGGDAVGTRTASPSGEKGETAIPSPRPDVRGTRDGTQSFSPDSLAVNLTFVTASSFVAVDEPGADALVGDEANVLVPEGGDVMFYGDGGAGKTTLMIDLGLHLAAGDDWLGISVGRPVRVAIVENEGPRPLFRAKLRRKLGAWKGSALEERLLLLEDPWSRVSLDDSAVRVALAGKVAELELDALLVGLVTRSGMNEAGTLQQVRDYAGLLGEVRAASGRRVTFLLAHHENRDGQVSGAWEGAVDTLFHVQAQGNGQTRLFVQKARWSPEHHKQKFQLAWAEGEGFEVIASEERDENAIADEILQYVLKHGGGGWNKVDAAVPGKGDRLREIRDNLLVGGRLLNLGSERA